MLDTPHITETAIQKTAVIRLTIPRGEIQNVMRSSATSAVHSF